MSANDDKACPPCLGNCQQGRLCPMKIEHDLGWVGLLLILAPWAVGVLVIWVWRLLA